MPDEAHAPAHLLAELESLRQEVSALKTLKAEQKQFEDKLRRQHSELESQARISNAILQIHDVDEQLNIMLDAIMRLLNVTLGGIYLVRDQEVILRCWRGFSGDLLPPEIRSFPLQATPDWLRQPEIHYEKFNGQRCDTDLPRQLDLQAWACIPLIRPPAEHGDRDIWMGAVIVASRQGESLTETDVETLKALADQLAAAIDHARNYREAEMRFYRLFILREIDRAITTRRTIPDILNVVVERVTPELGAAAIAVTINDQEHFDLPFHQMRLPNSVIIEDNALNLTADLHLHFMERQTPVIINNLAQDRRVEIDHEPVAPFKFVSYLGIPLIVHEKTIGLLQVLSLEPQLFSAEEIDFFSTLAGQTAIAVENVRMITETQRQAQELAALNKASRVMASSLDPDTVLEQVLTVVRHMLNAEGASVLLWADQNDDNLVFAAAASPGAKSMIGKTVPVTKSIAGWVVQTGHSLLIDDTQQDPRFYSHIDTLTGLTTRSLLAVPLIFKEKVIGVIEVINKATDAFNRHDLEILEGLSGSAAIAIENARLYEAEQLRYKESETLRRAALTLSSTIALDEVFARILTELKHVIPYDSASVQLLKGDYLEIIDGYGFPDLAQVLGTTFPIPKDTPNTLVIQSQEPVILDDVKQGGYLVFDQKPHTSVKIRSWMGVPLIIDERVIGMIALDKHEANFYTPDQARSAKAYAAQAAIALENARLHAEMEERAEQLAVLHELDRAITASLNINHVYHAFARHTARLISYDCMSIARLQGDDLQIVHAVGKKFKRADKETWMTPGATLSRKGSALGWVIRHGQPLLRNNIPANMQFAEDDSLIAEGIQSAMVIPLRVKRQIIGTWNIVNESVGTYCPDDLEIAQSMADQLAIAIENARLYEAEREQFRRLQQSQAQLIQVEKMAALGRLMASIAHEINNPLQSIQNCLSLVEEELASRQRSDKVNYYLSIAMNEIDRIVTIVRRMRDFYRPSRWGARSEASNSDSLVSFYRPARAELQRVDLHELLENVLQLVNKQLQHSLIKIERNWAEDLPLIEGIPDHLKQVFLNLVLNAIDTMSEAGGTLSIQTRLSQIYFQDDQPRPAVQLEFTDTGKGMTPEILSRLFEPFFTTKEHGSGLGLATSFQIIKAHNGQITAESQPEKGTTFTILLPTTQPET